MKATDFIRINGEVMTVRQSLDKGLTIPRMQYAISHDQHFGNIVGLSPKWKTAPGFYDSLEAVERSLSTYEKGAAKLITRTVLGIVGNGGVDYGRISKYLK